MSYRIKAGVKIGRSLCKVTRRQVKCAIEASHAPRAREESPVHATRKHLKKARAALILLAPVVGRKEFAKTDRKLKRVGNLLSEMRDAEVRFQTVRQLIDTFDLAKDRVVDDTATYLSFELENVFAAFADWEKEVATRLRKVARRLATWPAKKLNPRRLRGTLQKSYQAGVRSLQQAIDHPTAENFHTFRKSVKELTYQLRVLSPLHPPLFGAHLRELKVLAERLGSAHDLAFLLDRLRKLEPAGQEDARRASRLFELIELREKELQLRAAVLGEKFYAERAKDFATRISGYLLAWKAAQGDGIAETNRLLRGDLALTSR